MNQEEYSTFLEMAFEDNAENNPDLPVWVRSILSKLENSVLKEFASIAEGYPDNPADGGFAIGAVRHLKITFDEKLAEFENICGIKLDPKDLAEMEEELSSLDDFKQDKIHEIEDANQSDFSAFFSNLAKGSQSLYTEDNQLKHGSLDSEISLFMLMSWPHIEHNMKTRKDCYHFLIEKLGEQRVDSYERLEKYFERIRYSPDRIAKVHGFQMNHGIDHEGRGYPFPSMHVYDARRKIISLLEGPDLTVVVGQTFPHLIVKKCNFALEK